MAGRATAGRGGTESVGVVVVEGLVAVGCGEVSAVEGGGEREAVADASTAVYCEGGRGGLASSREVELVTGAEVGGGKRGVGCGAGGGRDEAEAESAESEAEEEVAVETEAAEEAEAADKAEAHDAAEAVAAASAPSAPTAAAGEAHAKGEDSAATGSAEATESEATPEAEEEEVMVEVTVEK